MDKQPTLDQVAERAGVSRGTASRVINNAPHVSKAKRAAVERAIEELGYIPNTAARSLVTQKAGSVLLVLSADDPAVFSDPFFAGVILGVNQALERTDLELSLVLAATDRGQDRLKRILQARRADGIMLLALHRDDPLSKLVRGAGIPVVYGGKPLNLEPEYYVDADNRGGARQAVEYLVSRGRRRIGAIAGPMDMDAAVARHRGFCDALAVAGLPTNRVAYGDYTEASGAKAMGELLSAYPEIDAIFAASDGMATGALRHLREAGVSVPGQIAIVGFDDIVTSRHTQPALTTVHQPISGLGHEMARMLLALMGGEPAAPLILPTKLVVRESA